MRNKQAMRFEGFYRLIKSLHPQTTILHKLKPRSGRKQKEKTTPETRTTRFKHCPQGPMTVGKMQDKLEKIENSFGFKIQVKIQVKIQAEEQGNV
jgi:hypothetical protein